MRADDDQRQAVPRTRSEARNQLDAGHPRRQTAIDDHYVGHIICDQTERISPGGGDGDLETGLIQCHRGLVDRASLRPDEQDASPDLTIPYCVRGGHDLMRPSRANHRK